MGTDIQTLRPYLKAFDLTGLMVEGLGWDHHSGLPISVSAGEERYDLQPVAEKARFAVYRCGPNQNGDLPPQSTRRRIEKEVTEINYEHLIVFMNAAKSRQIWQWVKRESGKPPVLRELRYDRGQTGTLLLQRLCGIKFTLEEEGNLGITDVTERVQQSLDIERVTKRFYNEFRVELTTFQQFIDGITPQGDRDWYASLMLNRMMFVYFIQKQGFLDGDEHYLSHRLRQVQEQAGPDQFQRFYRQFLLRLFHEGLGQPEEERSAELTDLLGNVPYLNGGIFDAHALERDNPSINIPDNAFKRIFQYFDQYSWHLDDRPSGNDNEINPEILGYIFEKYVNQRQMGAYYTKEDITGYIARNTVIPRLLEMAQQECPIAFGSDGGVWRLLQDDPDRYIYPSIGHGIAWDYSPESVAWLEEPLALPDGITCGLDDTSQRGDWNQAAPVEFALPTETWRELIARRQHYAEVRDKLAAGEVQSVNDLITLNLDSERFTRDVIVNSEGPELVRAVWSALTKISVLDPACGSGAFLFATLNILEPLYSASMQAMRDFLADLETSKRQRPPKALQDFRKILNDASRHRNERYYILKSIIVNNLYGVDIMEEAVEICRLRLFLKLAAQLESYDQIEPLPDIDFNIQAGNSLVGFTSTDSVRRAMTMDLNGQQRMITLSEEAALRRIEAKAAEVAREYEQFQQIQMDYGMGYSELAHSKNKLQSKLSELRGQLDALLAKEYGVGTASKAEDFQRWQASHQPFHWFVEFYEIVHRGGFDIVIGNPPYLEFKDVGYACRSFTCDDTRAIHALFIEQGINLLNKRGRASMIVPLALTSTQRMRTAQSVLETNGKSAWYANFAWRPGKLFDTVNRALTIFIVSPSESERIYATGYVKWTKYDREDLFDRVHMVEAPRSRLQFWVPKLSTTGESDIMSKMLRVPTMVANFTGRTDHKVFYRTTGGLYWKVFTDFPPAFVNAERSNSSREKTFSTRFKEQVKPLIAALSSDVFWWWYTVTSNLRDLNSIDINEFPVPESIFSDAQLIELSTRYLDSLQANSSMMTRHQQQTGRTETQSFAIKESKPIIDKIDRVLAEHYGFTDEELDFIINYDIKYRMGWYS